MLSCEPTNSTKVAEHHYYNSLSSSYALSHTYRYSRRGGKSPSSCTSSTNESSNEDACYEGTSTVVGSQDTMNGMGMGAASYNYVPQLTNASSAGFGSQYAATDLGHAYDSTRHTGNTWYSPGAATDPASRFNEYNNACKSVIILLFHYYLIFYF